MLDLSFNEIWLNQLAGKNARIANENAAEADRLRAYISQLECYIKKTEKVLQEWTDHANRMDMVANGRKEIIDYFKQTYPNDPYLTKTRKTFKDGTPFYGIHFLYAKGFDAKGKELGIKNPEKLRDN